MNATATNNTIESVGDILFAGCKESDVVVNFSVTAKKYYFNLIFLSSFAMLATFAANLLFLAAMIRHWRRITIGQKLLMALAAANLMQSLSTWPIQIYFHNLQLNGGIYCAMSSIRAGFAYGLAWTTAVAIFVISLEKYLAVAFPYAHQRLATSLRLLLSILIPSLLNMIVTFAIHVFYPLSSTWKLYKKVMVFSIVLLLAGIGLMQGHVTLIAHRTRKRISAQNAAEGKVIQQRAKAMKAAISIFAAFLFSYMPLVSFLAYTMATKDTSLFSRTYIKHIVELIALSNSFINTFVYYWSSKKIRQYVKQFVCGRQAQRTE